MAWWEKGPLRILEVVDTYDFDAISLEHEAKLIKNLKGNTQHFHCMAHQATKDDTAGLNEKRIFMDRLKTYTSLAHKRGIRLIVYFNIHWYTRGFGRKHPDWYQIKEDGSYVDDFYGDGVTMCINSPYREWVFKILRDLCKYEIDGIFYDGPAFTDSTCYCNYCKKLFKEKTGKDLPSKSDRAHPLWKELINFQSDSIALFLKNSNNIIKGINPEILLYMNCQGLGPFWPTGRDNHKIIKNSDMLIAEGGFLFEDINQVSIYQPGMTAKLLASQSGGKPVLVADCAGHKPWSWYMLPETEMSIMLAETLAGGANIWCAFHPHHVLQPEIKVVGKYNEFIKRNAGVFFRTKSLAKVALFWSYNSANFYAGSSVQLTDFTKVMESRKFGDVRKEFMGYYEGLVRAQVPFDVIDEENLKDLQKYQLLILPNSTCLSEGSVEYLSDFVEKGGNLVASFETSLYNEYGERKDNFQLNKLFGVDFAGQIFGPMRWDYVALSDSLPFGNRTTVRGINKKFLPAPTYGIEIKLTSGASPVFFCEKLVNRYEGDPKISSKPFLVTNQFGKGKVIYLAGTFGLDLYTYHFPDYLNLIKNFVSQLSRIPVTVENAPWVEVNLRQSMDKIFLHLVNHTSGVRRPLTYIQPLENLKIGFFGAKVKEIQALWTNKKLKLKKSGKGISFVLPYLENYEVISLR